MNVVDLALDRQHVGNFEADADAVQRERAGGQVDLQAAHAAAQREALHQLNVAAETDPLVAARVRAEAQLLQAQVEAVEVQRHVVGQVDPAAGQRDVALAVDAQPVQLDGGPVQVGRGDDEVAGEG